ncbi:hypothetical protein SNE40_009938 [Patella caerulea]|uniref:Uncharacterized protein n=1 Tax=Patella caerulea TaxID=87958 RepID=A0AAN8JQM7_PATCE
MAKILLRCIGRYVKGTGISNVLIECSIFGVNAVESVLQQGMNYARGLKGMLMLGEVFFRLHVALFLNSQSAVQSEFENLCQMQQKISSAENKVDHLDLDVNAENVFKCFREFVDRGEQLLYWDKFLIRVQILRNLIRSDRQGLWQLLLDTVQELQPVFAMLDCINFQRWSSLYLEDMRRLPKTAPEVREMFLKGKHVVKRNQRKFTAVAADMALEQTINRSQKSSAGFIGRTRENDFVAEWEITHHERLMISNFF